MKHGVVVAPKKCRPPFVGVPASTVGLAMDKAGIVYGLTREAATTVSPEWCASVTKPLIANPLLGATGFRQFDCLSLTRTNLQLIS